MFNNLYGDILTENNKYVDNVYVDNAHEANCMQTIVYVYNVYVDNVYLDNEYINVSETQRDSNRYIRSFSQRMLSVNKHTFEQIYIIRFSPDRVARNGSGLASSQEDDFGLPMTLLTLDRGGVH